MSKKGQITTTTYMDWNDFISVITRLEKDEDYKFCLLINHRPCKKESDKSSFFLCTLK